MTWSSPLGIEKGEPTEPMNSENISNNEVRDLSGTTACEIVYGFDIQAVFGTDNDVIGEERINVEKLSTCMYHWVSDISGTEEHLELWLEVKNTGSGNSFSEDLESTLENGELRHPMKPEAGWIEYELIDGPGDMTIWSSEVRSLQWHLRDNYYFIMNLDEKASPRSAEDDLDRMLKLASQVNARLGLSK